MASSKKYGYQLRGDKLSICELDLTGSGDGLNYTYTDNGGLDIATDPSSWKSPVETIPDGLQLEYLSSDLILSQPTPTILVGDPVSLGNRDSFLYINDILHGKHYWYKDYTGPYTAHYPLMPRVHSPEYLETVNNIYTNPPSLLTLSVPVDVGETYIMRGTLDVSWYRKFTEIGTPFGSPTIHINEPVISTENLSSTFEGGSTNDYQFIYPEMPSVSDDFSSYTFTEDTGTMRPTAPTFSVNVEVKFTATTESFQTRFDFPKYHIRPEHPLDAVTLDYNYGGAFDGVIATAPAYSLLSFHVEKSETIPIDEDLATINLPSYAQKALLDYVRAQEAYEGGDLQKWDFFMKQFRSKLERWEDSRITGPRVLGPSSSSIR